MEKWIIEVNNDDEVYRRIHDVWSADDTIYDHSEIHTQKVNSIPEAVQMFERGKHFLVIVYSGDRKYFKYLPLLTPEYISSPVILVKRNSPESYRAAEAMCGIMSFESPDVSQANWMDFAKYIVMTAKGLIRMHLRTHFGIPHPPV